MALVWARYTGIADTINTMSLAKMSKLFTGRLFAEKKLTNGDPEPEGQDVRLHDYGTKQQGCEVAHEMLDRVAVDS